MNGDKKTVFSGVQPSGNLTIGNYLGAIKNFSRFSEEYKTFYCVVDLHAITFFGSYLIVECEKKQGSY